MMMMMSYTATKLHNSMAKTTVVTDSFVRIMSTVWRLRWHLN